MSAPARPQPPLTKEEQLISTVGQMNYPAAANPQFSDLKERLVTEVGRIKSLTLDRIKAQHAMAQMGIPTNIQINAMLRKMEKDLNTTAAALDSSIKEQLRTHISTARALLNAKEQGAKDQGAKVELSTPEAPKANAAAANATAATPPLRPITGSTPSPDVANQKTPAASGSSAALIATMGATAAVTAAQSAAVVADDPIAAIKSDPKKEAGFRKLLATLQAMIKSDIDDFKKFGKDPLSKAETKANVNKYLTKDLDDHCNKLTDKNLQTCLNSMTSIEAQLDDLYAANYKKPSLIGNLTKKADKVNLRPLLEKYQKNTKPLFQQVQDFIGKKKAATAAPKQTTS